MQVWPAIDLCGGKCVRLQQGDYQRQTVFGDDPARIARRWVDESAECLHLVDLDGALDGRIVNRSAIEAIVRAAGVPCQLGGGIRDNRSIDSLLELGLERLVIGTRAIDDAEWFRGACRRHPGRLALAIDARDGRAATRGWVETSDVAAVELALRFADEPLAAIVYTDIATDGMLAGPNVAAMAEMQRAVAVPVIASGGVTTADDVARLAAVPMAGCIIGRALYEGKLTMSEALRAAAGEGH